MADNFQASGEQELFRLHPSRLIYLKFYLMSTLLVALTMLLFMFPQYLALVNPPKNLFPLINTFPFVMAIIVVFFSEISLHQRTYTITNFRVIERKGIFSINEDYIMWNRVSNCDLNESFIDRIFNLGSVFVKSTGAGGDSEIDIQKVREIRQIKSAIDGLITKKD